MGSSSLLRGNSEPCSLAAQMAQERDSFQMLSEDVKVSAEISLPLIPIANNSQFITRYSFFGGLVAIYSGQSLSFQPKWVQASHPSEQPCKNPHFRIDASRPACLRL